MAKQVFFISVSVILSVAVFAIACALAFGQDSVSSHVWTYEEMDAQPCVRSYRTIYPSDCLCCGVFGIPVRNFHYWNYDMTHVTWIPPAALFPQVPGHEEEVQGFAEKEYPIPCYPGEEADRVPTLKTQEDLEENGETEIF